MKHSCRLLALFGMLYLSAAMAFGQIVAQDPAQALVKDFLYALYQTKQDPLIIAQRYVALQEGPNDLSVAVRYQGVAEHLAMLRKGQAVGQSTANSNKPIVFNPAINKVLPYSELSHIKHLSVSLTDEQEKNVYVLIENEEPLRYFIVRSGKILSFDYMVKGADGPAYFLAY